MSGKVVLNVTSPIPAGQPATMLVQVSGAKPGSDVTMVVEQKRGVPPLAPRQAQAALADAAGAASMAFQMTLTGPGSAAILATAYDAVGTFYDPDVEAVQVDAGAPGGEQ